MSRKKSAAPGKKEDQGKTAESLMTQITKDLNAEAATIEELTREEKNKGHNIIISNSISNATLDIIC